jgi:hypothetical protein
MLIAEHALAGLQRAAVEGLGFAVAALGTVQNGEVVDADERVRMLIAEHALGLAQRDCRDLGCLVVTAIAVQPNGDPIQRADDSFGIGLGAVISAQLGGNSLDQRIGIQFIGHCARR